MSQAKITISKGKVSFGRPGIKKLLRSAPDGVYMLSLEEWKAARSNRQNAFIHVCFDVYGKEIGYSPLEAKFLLKKEFGLNRLIRNKRTDKQELLIRDTRDYSVEEMAVFIDRILTHFEIDCGIIIDAETRKQFHIDDTGELTELS